MSYEEGITKDSGGKEEQNPESHYESESHNTVVDFNENSRKK